MTPTGVFFYARKGLIFREVGYLSVCELHGDIRESMRDHERRIALLEKSDAEFTITLCCRERAGKVEGQRYS
jgi:hypothetical protein